MAVSAFMITMDNTVVAIAQETIRKDLNLSYSELRWVTVGYILMFSCLMIAGGRLTDIYGCRITYVTGMTIFTGSSAVCGLAGSDAVLILARVVQGAGSALALPATLVMVTVGRSDRQRALGQVTWLGSLALAMAGGPSIGGFIVEHWHWGWIFLINVPTGIAVIALGLVVLVGRDNEEGTPVDLPGVLLSATALFALVYAFHVGGDLGFTDPAVLSVLVLAVIAAGCFVIVESWAPDPMIDLDFFRNRVFTGGIVTSMLWGIGFNGVMYFSALFMQTVLGFKPTTAALAYIPSALLVLVMTPVSFMLAAKAGSRLTISVGMVLMAAGMSAFTALRPGHGFAALMPGIALVSVGSAMTLPLAMYVLKSVPDERAGVAGGIVNVVRELSAGIGIAVLGVVVDTLEKHAAQSGAGRAEAFRQGASVGLLVGAGLVVVGAVVSALTLPTKREARSSDSARKPKPPDGPEKPARHAPVPGRAAEPVREPRPVAVGAPMYAAPVGPDMPDEAGGPGIPVNAVEPDGRGGSGGSGGPPEPGGPYQPSGPLMPDGPDTSARSSGRWRTRRIARRTPRYGLSSARAQSPPDSRQPPRPPRQGGPSGWERASRASAELWPPPPPPGWYKPYDPDDYYDGPGSADGDTGRPRFRGDAW